jgi:uncharacterized protein YqjF (DUF2071 family)
VSGALGAAAGAAASASEALIGALGARWPSYGQGGVVRETGHRPWPLPEGRWLMAQSWEDLLFAHWRVPEERLRPLLPPELPLDTFDGSAWVGVTPFCVSAFRLHGLPHVPRVTAFAETNVRTYATLEGKPGIFFLSLDAASVFAVLGARRSYRLPYFRARMQVRREGGQVDYRSRRVSRRSAAARLDVRYRPAGEASPAEPGTLEYFLAERYCLYTTDERGTPQRADIHHPPWPLQPAEADFAENSMASPWGLELDGEPLLHFARRQDVVIWALGPVRRD